MTKILKSLLVGAYNHPPAKVILEALPEGTSLRLEVEPSNPWDENAIKVFVKVDAIPKGQFEELEVKLPGMGFTLADLLREEEVFLGYVAKTGGKPLEKARAKDLTLVGNKEIWEADCAISEAEGCKLSFGPNGEPYLLIPVP
jgi:hypothetical protein